MTEYKYLGFWLDNSLSFLYHIDQIVKKSNKRLGLIKQSYKYLGKQNTLILYKSLVLPVLDYGDLLYHHASANALSSLQVVQNKFAGVLLQCDWYTPSDYMHNGLKLMKLYRRREYHMAIFVFKAVKGLLSEYICTKIRFSYNDRGWVTRAQTRGDLMIPPVLLKITEASFSYHAPKVWNSFPPALRNAETVLEFKNLYFDYYGYV